MKALIKQQAGEGHIALCEVPEPTAGPYEVKIAVKGGKSHLAEFVIGFVLFELEWNQATLFL